MAFVSRFLVFSYQSFESTYWNLQKNTCFFLHWISIAFSASWTLILRLIPAITENSLALSCEIILFDNENFRYYECFLHSMKIEINTVYVFIKVSISFLNFLTFRIKPKVLQRFLQKRNITLFYVTRVKEWSVC